MAKKKKKKVQPTIQRIAPVKLSNTYLETCYATARRMMPIFGEEESTFDMFTKRQKQNIFKIVVPPPHIAVMPGHKVPKPYVRYIQEELIGHMKRIHFDKQHKITLMEMATVGLSIYFTFSVDKFLVTLPPEQANIVLRIRKVFEIKDTFLKIQEQIMGELKVLLILFSRPNFRIYGQCMNAHQPTLYNSNFQQIIHITSHECQTLRFRYRNIERTAFRLALGQSFSTPYEPATIPINKLFPNSKQNKLLNIYVQSHAIYRFKERIDTILPILRNEFLTISLMFVQKIVWAPNNTPLIACIISIDGTDKTVGYFAVTIDGDNLLVLTFLPILSYNVPEGRILYERLHLSPDDMKYLGMDKLSFFYEVDISQIPVLKQVIYDELHLEYIRTTYHSYRDKYANFNEKKTLFVKNFFQKLEEHTFYNDIKPNTDIDLLKE
jgi:hypothetical protein